MLNVENTGTTLTCSLKIVKCGFFPAYLQNMVDPFLRSSRYLWAFPDKIPSVSIHSFVSSGGKRMPGIASTTGKSVGYIRKIEQKSQKPFLRKYNITTFIRIMYKCGECYIWCGIYKRQVAYSRKYLNPHGSTALSWSLLTNPTLSNAKTSSGSGNFVWLIG